MTGTTVPTEHQKFKAAKARWKHHDYTVTYDQNGVKLRITANGFTSTHYVATLKQGRVKIRHSYPYPFEYETDVVKDFIKLAEKTFN